MIGPLGPLREIILKGGPYMGTLELAFIGGSISAISMDFSLGVMLSAVAFSLVGPELL